MRTCVGVLGLIAAGVTATGALADCPTGTPPQEVPVSGWTQGPAGASVMSVAEGEFAVIYRSAATWSVQAFKESPTGWALDQVFLNASPLDRVGIKGDLLAIASHGTVSGSEPATITLYRRQVTTGTWTLSQTIPAAGSTYAVCPSPTWFVTSTSSAGVRVYRFLPNGTAALAETLVDPAGTSFFGYAVVLDGDFLAISALGDGEAGDYVGAVYVFKYDSVEESWLQVQKIIPSPATATLGFGTSIAMRSGKLAIGSVHTTRVNSDPFPVSNANGFVNVYAWNGAAFTLQAHLTHPRGAGAQQTGFGNAVGIDGNRLLVGAYLDNYNGVNSGAAYVFDYDGAVWQPTGAISLGGAAAGSWFGTQLGLTSTSAIAVAPFYHNREVAAAVFSSCSLPSTPAVTPRCVPGIQGLMSFVMRWFLADPWTDFNADGAINLRDLWEYLDAWFAGCP